MSKNLANKVYYYLTTIPKGKVATYLDVANYLGNKHFCRVVGNILHKNKEPIKYPCYKIVSSKGCLAKNYGFGGLSKQKELLEKDGIEVINGKVDLKKYHF